jgi:cytochrome P450
MPMFSADHIAPLAPQFKEAAQSVISQVKAMGAAEVGADIALPYVMSCLSIIYNRPQDREEWTSWGPNVWFAEVWMSKGELNEETKRAQRERNYSVKTQRSATVLDNYLNRVLDEAEKNQRPHGQTGDIWDFLTQIEPGGQKLTRDEMLGMGSVLLAGGRDTVIKLITGWVWHLIQNPNDRAFLRDNPERRLDALHEMARFLSPLPKIERLIPGATDDAQENRTLLSFASANFDRSAFDDPETVDIHRPRIPNVAFGFGRHSCLGLQITEFETLSFLEVILADWPDWELAAEPTLVYADEGDGDTRFRIIDEFESVPLRVSR